VPHLRSNAFPLLLILILLAGGPQSVRGAEGLVKVRFTNDAGNQETREGRVRVEAVDGGLLLEDRAQQLWTIPGEKRKSLTDTGLLFQHFSAEELGRQMLAEFGEGFEIVRTDHYVICTNAGKPYAQWCGDLLERLLSAFLTHWRGKPLSLERPSTPLPVIVFATAEEFARFAARDASPATAESKGYYSVRTNRIVIYDLTAGNNAEPAKTRADIERKIAARAFNVATVVHEATHQMAFNCGLHTRYADNPVWLTEGMAMYFETPDLNNRTGWRTIGQINRARLKQFQQSLPKRNSPGSLVAVISSDERLTTAETAAEAYAEAWALSYFLIKKRRAQYADYLHKLSQKKPLLWNKPEERLAEFKAAFGDIEKLDQEFLRYFSRIR
jgi:hypothetical protein